jgi:hypothetical protein
VTTAADLIDLATGLLEDPGNDVWGRTELLGYLNDGLKYLASKRPAEFVASEVVELAEGSKQSLPAGSIAVVRPICNMDGTGTVRGRSIRFVDLNLLDASSPTWRTTSPGETRQLALSPDPRSEFWVSPPADAGSKIELMVERDPVVHTQGTTLEVDAKWHPALINYMVSRALSKDSEYAQDGKAAAFLQVFMNQVEPPVEPQ